MRPYWRHYYTGTQGILFVVDACDTGRLDMAAAELRSLAVDEQLAAAPIVVLVNKADAPRALKADEIARRMELSTYVAPLHFAARLPPVAWWRTRRVACFAYQKYTSCFTRRARVPTASPSCSFCSLLAGHQWTAIDTVATKGTGLEPALTFIQQHSQRI